MYMYHYIHSQNLPRQLLNNWFQNKGDINIFLARLKPHGLYSRLAFIPEELLLRKYSNIIMIVLINGLLSLNQLYVAYCSPSHVEADWKYGSTVATAQNFARELMEMPCNHLTPTKFVEIVTNKLSSVDDNMEYIGR